ncbi:hypothetical protein CGGC5_v009818 [Colletotrichum fructicola Nara gc5]|uniref:Uncharacterized protein n=1 Tax=Colletotrichum fructicola (strain Nara gc5) TaxID=1213859 RepID=A0A7J6J254_COLFN|nr:hypothetical protein CGGC5_v009818 [Colletotrichum fructicola Nara gc5]KAF5509823.1 hypothetical protein CGCF413_v003425 [Colletotrichum fructicola]
MAALTIGEIINPGLRSGCSGAPQPYPDPNPDMTSASGPLRRHPSTAIRHPYAPKHPSVYLEVYVASKYLS